VKTNIVIFDCEQTGKNAIEWCDILFKRGLWVQDTALYSVRLVTHCDVDEAQIERALAILREEAAKLQGVTA
jgi:threonine aldolase